MKLLTKPVALGDRPILPLIVTYMRNAWLDYLRAWAQSRTHSIDEQPQIEWRHWVPTPEYILERKELGEMIAAAMRKLPAAQVSAIELTLDDQYDEAAASLGVARGTVASRLCRGRRKLQRLLAAHI